MNLPKLLITLGDVAGIGPEVVAKAWPKLHQHCQPVVIGDPEWMKRGLALVGVTAEVRPIRNLDDARPDRIEVPVLVASTAKLSGVKVGEVSAEAGQAAHDWLVYAIDECRAGRAAGIVTCPLHKEGLHAAGVHHPGHTEILAERTGSQSHAMLLYDDDLPLAVAHVTLHQSLRSTFGQITTQNILNKIQLLQEILPRLTGTPARIGVAALNPHASDGGLFGTEEAEVIAPAVLAAQNAGVNVQGPIATDAIFLPHNRKRFNGIVCQTHDHGHIAMKLIGGRRAVNVTAGLPIIRTSVAHGTAYDIAGQGIADESSLVAAVRVAAQLAKVVPN
jgi:4-hydroxythreonine-4-phosphate dehydrogenase